MPGKRLFRLLVLAALFTLLIPLAGTTPGAAADGDDNQFTIPEKAELKYPNLGSMLNQMVARVEEEGATAEDAAGDAPVHRAESVAVTIHLSGNVDGVVQFLEDFGGDPRNVGEDYIEAYVPVSLLGPVSEQPGVLRVREIVPPPPDFGDVTSQGVQAHLSAAWNQAGYSGQGVKVGIIDLGFKELTSLMGTELPARVQGRCYTDIGVFTQDLADCEAVDEVTVAIPECLDDAQRRAVRSAIHGTVVAESLIDIAPEVSLYIANPQSWGDLQDATEWMASEGVSVINHSVGWTFDGPGDGTSPFSASPLNTVDRAVASDILWVNAAGNGAQETWFGGYSDPDGDGAINFDGGDDEVIDMPVRACRRSTVQLRWEDNWDGASTDLDLYLYDKRSGILFPLSVGEQSGRSGHVPFEAFSVRPRIDSDDFGIVVVHYGGDAPGWIQLVVWQVDPIQPHTGSGSVNNPAESANPGMLAVGAAPWYDVHTIEAFSSRGPTPDGRVKPDIVGADCGETALAPLNENRRGFCGTSQAAPHVAGMAALVRQRFPGYTPAQVAAYLKDNAEQRELPTPGNTWGHGFAQLPPLLSPDTLPTVVFANMNWYSVELQNRIARYIVENGYGHPTNLVSGSTLALIQALRDGDVDVMMEVWLPMQRQAWEASLAAGDVLSLGASLGTDWQSAFVIPAYLQEQHPELDSVEDLKGPQYQALFATAESGGKARLVSCVIGWACTEINDDQIEGYGLSDHVHIVNPSSETALYVSLYGAYESQEPWLGFQWGTSTPALLLDLVRLEEPEYSDECWRTTRACAHPDSTILIGVNSSLPERVPEVVEFLGQWDFTADVHLRSVTRWQAANPDASIEDTALYWLGNNIDTWSGWVTAEAATGILASLDKDALVALYNATDGDNWLENTNWMTSGALSTWHGVTTDSEGRVTELDLTRNQLKGEIPVELGNLSNLKSLDLSSNRLTGPIPAELGNLSNLESLYLGSNELTGCIPAGLQDVPYNDFSGLGLPFCAEEEPVPVPAGPCLVSLGALTTPVTLLAAWTGDCPSEGQANNYARYYTFTLSEETRVAIYLTSSRDTDLYLRQGEGRNGAVVHDNNNVVRGNINSRIEETLAAGTYTVEATTYYRRGVTGDFTLDIRPVTCVQQLGTLTETHTTPGAWSDDCVSARQAGNYHRSYRFTLGAPTDLQIDLTSERDTYLYLMREDGTVLDQNNNVGRGNINSRIVQTALAAGTYTVEATTYHRNPVTGNFVLNIGLIR